MIDRGWPSQKEAGSEKNRCSVDERQRQAQAGRVRPPYYCISIAVVTIRHVTSYTDFNYLASDQVMMINTPFNNK